MSAIDIKAVHRRRLRQMWRSAGWPFQDLVEVELLAAGLLQRRVDEVGRETLRVTDAGVALLAATLQGNRAGRDAHEALVAQVALHMQRAGRVVWRGLSLRAWVGEERPAPAGPGTPGAASNAPEADLFTTSAMPSAAPPAQGLPGLTEVPSTLDEGLSSPSSGQWVMAMPDVYSIRHTTVQAYVEPIVHEVKVRRADLLADVRRPAKGQAYRAISSECWYVLKAGIGTPADVPAAYGVIQAHADGQLEVLRPAPRRAMTLPFAVWMALARATPQAPPDEPEQGALGDV